MNYWEYLTLFMSVICGGGIAFYYQRNNKALLQLMLSFSGAYILGISVLHLMPTVFSGEQKHIGLWILAGFFVQLILEQFSGGVEHGHIHAPHDGRGRFAIQVMIGLCLHAFLEGMPLGGAYEELQQHVHHGHTHSHQHLLWGIVLHKAPAAFALVLLFNLSGFKPAKVAAALVFFAMMSPMGAATAAFFESRGLLTANHQLIIVALVIGSFLHIATTILFETDNSQHHRIPIRKLIAISIGIGLAILTVVI